MVVARRDIYLVFNKLVIVEEVDEDEKSIRKVLWSI